MKKKLGMLAFLVILPQCLSVIYDHLFRYSANFFEDYQNYFKFTFLVISILGTLWLLVISKKDGSKVWFWSMVILLALLLFYLYWAIAILSMTFSF